MNLFTNKREKKELKEEVDWKVAMEGNNSNIDRLRNVATQVNIDPVMGEVVRENEESDKQVEDTFKELAKELDGITPKDPDTGKKISIKPYTEKLTLDESLFNEEYYDVVTDEVLHFLDSKGYDINDRRVKNYADAVAEYIDMSREALGEYSLEDWYKDTKENYPEELSDLAMKEEFLEEKKACRKDSKHLCEGLYDEREYTDMLFDMVENNMLDAKLVLKSLMYWVSEDDIHKFMKLNDLLWYEDDEDEDMEESLQERLNKILKEAYSDGWDTDKLDELVSFLDELDRLSYEVRNCVKGAYSNCKTYSELGNYISNLGMQLSEVGDEVAEIEEDSEEEYDESLNVKKNKLVEYVAEDEVVEDEYTVSDLLNDRLFGYGLKKSNFRGKWKFAEVAPAIKTKEGKIKRTYFYPTAHSDELVTGGEADRRAFVEDGIGVYLYDESEDTLAKKCAEELNLDYDFKKLTKPVKGFNYLFTIYLPDEIYEMPLEDYVKSIGKSMKDFKRSKNDGGSRSDFGDHQNYKFRRNK